MKKLTKIIRNTLIVIGLCLASIAIMFFCVYVFTYYEQVVVINDTDTKQLISVSMIESDNHELIREEKQIEPNKKAVFNQVLLSEPVCIAGMDFDSTKLPLEIKNQMKLEFKERPFRTVTSYNFKFSTLLKLAEKYPCTKK